MRKIASFILKIIQKSDLKISNLAADLALTLLPMANINLAQHTQILKFLESSIKPIGDQHKLMLTCFEFK